MLSNKSMNISLSADNANQISQAVFVDKGTQPELGHNMKQNRLINQDISDILWTGTKQWIKCLAHRHITQVRSPVLRSTNWTTTLCPLVDLQSISFPRYKHPFYEYNCMTSKFHCSIHFMYTSGKWNLFRYILFQHGYLMWFVLVLYSSECVGLSQLYQCVHCHIRLFSNISRFRANTCKCYLFHWTLLYTVVCK